MPCSSILRICLSIRAESAFVFILTGRFDDVLGVIKKFVPGNSVESLLVSPQAGKTEAYSVAGVARVRTLPQKGD